MDVLTVVFRDLKTTNLALGFRGFDLDLMTDEVLDLANVTIPEFDFTLESVVLNGADVGMPDFITVGLAVECPGDAPDDEAGCCNLASDSKLSDA